MGIYAGTKCPVCEKKFTDADDIVVCPICGTPYHRECYQTAGHCINEKLHRSHTSWSAQGAQREEEQKYDGNAPLRCSKCGTINPPDGIFCQICGCRLSDKEGPHASEGPMNPDPITMSAYTTPYGGVSPDEEIDGISVRDLALFVGENSFYFIPRFLDFYHGKKSAGWNWGAFFFHGFYFLYRKMYGLGIGLLALGGLFNLPGVLCSIGIFYQAPTVLGMNILLLNRIAVICNILTLGLSLFCSMAANRLYYHYALRHVKAIHGRFKDIYSQEYILALTKGGRTNRRLILILVIVFFIGSMFLSTLFTFSLMG